MRLLGINTLHTQFGISLEENLKTIKECGFDCVFSSYRQGFPTSEAATYANSVGLFYETLHAPFTRCGMKYDLNSMWCDDNSGDEYKNLLEICINSCSENRIEKCIIHNAVSENPPPVSDIGLKRFKELCSYAKDKNVHIAFENLESLEHLRALMDIAGDFHGICWDCGHNLCYTPMANVPKLYPRKIIATHIHDNNGITRPGIIHYSDDLHLLPFDGVMDWEWYCKEIKASEYEGPLTLEVKRPDGCTDAKAFYSIAFERALKLAQMCK